MLGCEAKRQARDAGGASRVSTRPMEIYPKAEKGGYPSQILNPGGNIHLAFIRHRPALPWLCSQLAPLLYVCTILNRKGDVSRAKFQTLEATFILYSRHRLALPWYHGLVRNCTAVVCMYYPKPERGG